MHIIQQNTMREENCRIWQWHTALTCMIPFLKLQKPQNRKNQLIEFLENLEVGKHPFFGACSDTLDLGDKEIQKYFHEIKLKLKSVSKNEKWDW